MFSPSSVDSVGKRFVITVKGFEPTMLPQCQQDTDERQQWFIRFPEFQFHLGKTPLYTFQLSTLASTRKSWLTIHVNKPLFFHLINKTGIPRMFKWHLRSSNSVSFLPEHKSWSDVAALVWVHSDQRLEFWSNGMMTSGSGLSNVLIVVLPVS